MAKPAYAVRASVRVNGVTYRSPTDAFVAADQIEHDAAERADTYRRSGDEGLADTAVDRGREQAETLRTWARQREEFEARETEQPPARPTRTKSPPRTGGRRQDGSRRPPAPRRRRSSSSGAFGGRTGSVARRGYARSGAQAQVRAAGTLGWQIAGATIGIALLTLFLTRRGTGAFADLTGFAATALKLVVDPVDPLRPHLLDEYIAQAQAANLPATPLPPSSATRRSPSTSLASRRAPTNRRRSTRGTV